MEMRDEPTFTSSKDWLGVVLYQNTTTPEPDECSVTSIPTVYAFSEGCRLEEEVEPNISLSGAGPTYTGMLKAIAMAKRLPVKMSRIILGQIVRKYFLKAWFALYHTLFDGWLLSSPFDDSLFAQNDVGVGPDANPLINILAVILTLGGGFAYSAYVCFFFSML